MHPILEWNYWDVWLFLKGFDLEFCRLYEDGFTSIGNRLDSRRNPRLRIEVFKGNCGYLPAWALDDESFERAGREEKKGKKG